MHALLITFTSAATLEQLAEPFTDYAHAMHDVPGIVGKTWIVDGSTVGGFNVFTDEAAADAYLAGDLWATVTGNPAFSDIVIRSFGVVDALTAITSPSALTAAA